MIQSQNPMKVRKVIEREFPGLGAKIKEARESDRRSLAEICRQMPMSPMNWYKIEAEETKSLPIETLRRIEEVLGVDLGIDLDDETMHWFTQGKLDALEETSAGDSGISIEQFRALEPEWEAIRGEWREWEIWPKNKFSEPVNQLIESLCVTLDNDPHSPIPDEYSIAYVAGQLTGYLEGWEEIKTKL